MEVLSRSAISNLVILNNLELKSPEPSYDVQDNNIMWDAEAQGYVVFMSYQHFLSKYCIL